MQIPKSFGGVVYGLAGLLTVLVGAPGASAGTAAVDGLGFARFEVPVISMKERKWLEVVRQQYDFSCGSAAIATLLTFHYHRPTDEAAVLRDMFEEGDKALITTRGFSMLDMKRYLDSQGLSADGFRLTLDDLARIRLPVIALVDQSGYKHFVVVKGLSQRGVLVGDPALGLQAMSRERFQKIWLGPVLAIRVAVPEARETFNKDRAWSVFPAAPIRDALARDQINRGLASSALLLTRVTPFQF